jgi:hypothetical protein
MADTDDGNGRTYSSLRPPTTTAEALDYVIRYDEYLNQNEHEADDNDEDNLHGASTNRVINSNNRRNDAPPQQ